MLIICCGMPRSGSTLQYQLTSAIVEFKLAGQSLGLVPVTNSISLNQLLQNNSLSAHKYLVIKRHKYTDEAAELVKTGKAKAIYVYRDLRDVVVSVMNKRQESFEQIAKGNFVENCLDNFYKWASLEDIFVSKYEELTVNLKKEVMRISNYLGFELNEDSAEKIAENYSLDRQIQRIKNFDYETQGIGQGSVKCEPISLLHQNHISSGKSGQWRHSLSRQEVSTIENIADFWLIEKGYKLSCYLENDNF